jgi:hypothetical protein
MGAAVITQRKLIPVVWDLAPTDLPGWTKGYQALNLHSATVEQVRQHLSAISDRIRTEKFWNGFLAAILIGGLLYAAGKTK